MLKELGIYDRFMVLSQVEGQEAYEERLVSGLAADIFIATGLHPTKSEPKREFLKQWFHYLVSSGSLPVLEEAWKQKKEQFGILTPPRPRTRMGFADYVGMYCDPNHIYIDRYSEPSRYKKLTDAIREDTRYGGRVIEFGCGTAETLIDIAVNNSLLTSCIGVDLLTPEEVFRSEMMRSHRFANSDAKLQDAIDTNRQELEGLKIHLLQGSVFDWRIRKRICEHFTPIQYPTIVICFNLLFPHFDQKMISKGIYNMLKLSPLCVMVAGGEPAIEYYDYLTQAWTKSKYGVQVDLVTHHRKWIDPGRASFGVSTTTSHYSIDLSSYAI